MKITSVEPQKNNPRRFNIFLDGQFAFGADEDLVVDERLVIGKEIAPQDLEILLEEAEMGKLMERMYGLFGRRQRSEKEIKDYFRTKNYEARIRGKEEISELVISELVNKLKRKGLLNDLEFATAWVESRSKKKGLNAIKVELFKKGIDKEIIDQVLGSKYQVSREDETAKKLLEKKLRVWKNLPQIEFKQKALSFLVSRGFDYSIAKDVIDYFLKKD